MTTPAQRTRQLAPRHKPSTIAEVCAQWARVKRRHAYLLNVPADLTRALDALLEEHMQA